MPKVSLEQRRLEALRRQLSGKSPAASRQPLDNKSSKTGQFSVNNLPTQRPTTIEDTTYLRHDLTKILILSTLAIVFQLCLYLASIKHLVNF